MAPTQHFKWSGKLTAVGAPWEIDSTTESVYLNPKEVRCESGAVPQPYAQQLGEPEHLVDMCGSIRRGNGTEPGSLPVSLLAVMQEGFLLTKTTWAPIPTRSNENW